MDPAAAFFRWSELDRTTFPEFRDRIAEHDAEGEAPVPRSYPGYPRWPLPRPRRRLGPALDRALLLRRSALALGTAPPGRRTLGRLLHFAHGVTAPGGRGPVPSAGGLQVLEMYLVVFVPSWLPAGLYHYDRAGHHLSQLGAGADRDDWRGRVPSLVPLPGGALLWVLVGDGERVVARYGARGHRFLLLEAGHLMQNLCLLSASLGLATVPLGGFLEGEVASAFGLPAADVVLYVGVCGGIAGGGP